MSNCPNCGAPIVAPVCDYCGTRHWGFEQVSGHPASKVTQMLDQGLITANEARRMMGLTIDDELELAKIRYTEELSSMKRLYSEAIIAMRRYAD